jgi:endonuclease/exonuclease/phosphatase family metal-dependent hydrolase
MMRIAASLAVLLLVPLSLACGDPETIERGRAGEAEEDLVLKVATFNIEDLRTAELEDPTQLRPRKVAAILQQIRPDILLINEIAYDQPSAPGWVEGQEPGQNGQRFADRFLAESQGDGLEPIRYESFMRPVNTGVASGLDLDNDGRVSLEPPSRSSRDRGDEQTEADRAYGQDAWGFGTFPGQYGMALLVREGLEILEEEVRTFQTLAWSRMPGALEPEDPGTGQSWYSADEWSDFRLSSKSHWDVPIHLPGGGVLHALVSHPTPPAFDGPEMRNRKRNHDEIRFWTDYLDGASYIQDDAGRTGGLPDDRLFVLLGDLNADPKEGNSLDEAVNRLLEHPRVNNLFVPEAGPSAAAELPHLDRTDTAGWGLRVDYVLPSANLEILDGGVWRHHGESGFTVSDHFPVWLDIAVPIVDHP